MNSSARVEWRFGDGPEDGAAWLAHPETLQGYVDFRPPDVSDGTWRRLMVMSQGCLRGFLDQSAGASFFPALIVVRDGSPEQMRAEIDSLLRDGWPLLAKDALVLPKDYTPTDW